MSQKNKVIAIGIQHNYKVASAVMIKSLLENNPESIFDVYVLTDADLTDYFDSLGFNNCNIHICIIDVTEIKDVDCGRFGLGTLYRLLMDKYIPHHIDKVLYLDSDIIINSNIDELFNVTFSEHELVAGVECSISKEHVKNLGISSGKIFNAGVILFSFRKSCEYEVFSRSRDYVIKNNTSFNDQDALNYVLDGKIKYIEPTWNYELFRAKRDLIFNKIDAGKIKIVHFTGKDKPWDYEDINPYSYLYKYYYKKLFRNEMEFADVTFKKKIKRKILVTFYNYPILSCMYIFLQNTFRTRTK